jgi:selenide,water dikinase
VHPETIWTKSGAQPGDTLYLTKPLGTGLILTGHKRGHAGSQQLERATRWMRTLNDCAAATLRGFAPHAVTDVTGFGLFGHAHEMAERSNVQIRLDSGRLPAIDGARDFAAPYVAADGISEVLMALAYDPQTAGGLLVSVAAEKGTALEAAFERSKLFVRRIGGVADGSGVLVV